ncbi:hypothetical protein B0D95_08010 [Cellvibrio sp. PSBB023]|nr:hypothetical protein B0D95_08010 [Cellvibrio sp. PSBB023]
MTTSMQKPIGERDPILAMMPAIGQIRLTRHIKKPRQFALAGLFYVQGEHAENCSCMDAQERQRLLKP